MLKAQIRSKITDLLRQITGNERALMEYKNYESEIVAKQGIELIGWVEKYGPIVNTSQLAHNVRMLQAILDDLNRGLIKFVRLSRAEMQRRLEVHQNKIRNGELLVRERKRRKDLGKKRTNVQSYSHMIILLTMKNAT